MTPPGKTAALLAAAWLLGMGLGLGYGLLYPLRRRHPHLADGLFVAGTVTVWLYLGFGICAGDLRFFQPAGLLGGAGCAYLLLGREVGRAAAGVNRRISRVFHRLFQPFYRILKKIGHFSKITFASGRKSVTIK